MEPPRVRAARPPTCRIFRDLPEDALQLVACGLKHPADQRAFALACKGAAALVHGLRVRSATIKTSVLIDRPPLERANYVEDLSAIFSALDTHRLRELRSLRLDVDSAVLRAGGRRSRPFPALPDNRHTLRHLSVYAADAHVGSRATARLLAPWTNLRTLTLQGIQNLCIAHFKAMAAMRLCSLALDRCRCSAALLNRPGEGLLDGAFLPESLTHLHFDVHLPRALSQFMRQVPERLLLSRLRVQTLHLSTGLDAACGDPVWLAHSLSKMAHLQSVTTDSDRIFLAFHLASSMLTDAQRIRMRRVVRAAAPAGRGRTA